MQVIRCPHLVLLRWSCFFKSHDAEHGCLRRVEATLQRLAELLAASTHSPLRALLHSALLPAASAALRLGALVHHPEGSPAAPSPGHDIGSGSGQDPRVQLRGRAWALLGLVRLHLAAPPPGADPAAKRAMKAAHLDARAAEELLPELQARNCVPCNCYVAYGDKLAGNLAAKRALIWLTWQNASGRSCGNAHVMLDMRIAFSCELLCHWGALHVFA